MRWCLLAAVAAVLLVAAGFLVQADKFPAQADHPLPAFEFRGHHIGEEINKYFPFWQQGYRGLDLSSCEKNNGDTIVCYEAEANIGGSEVGISYWFYNRMLYSVVMVFDEESYSNIKTLVEGKYGKPLEEYNDHVQNAMGVIFNNTISEWKFREGLLKLHMRSGKIDTGALEFDDPTVDQKISAQDSQKLLNQGKKAF